MTPQRSAKFGSSGYRVTTFCKSMLCNAIHSNPKDCQIEHLDKLRQAQGMSKITYHNYLILLCTTAFQLDLKCPKCSMNHTKVSSTNSAPNNSKSSSCHGHGHSWHITNAEDEAKIPNLMPILIAFPYPMNYGNPYQHILYIPTQSAI